jgi:DUF1365 family protein
MTESTSCIYRGNVMHRRTRPRRHKLTYKVFASLLDLNELDTLHTTVRGFGYNRFSLLSFFNRDHGPGTDEPLRPWVEQVLGEAGVDLNGGAIKLLCYPRILGYVFNPLCNYFCYASDGTLAAIIHEVSNTFGQRHCYVFAVPSGKGDNGGRSIIRQTVDKCFYVSPFIDMDMTYNFRIVPPGDEIAVAIHETDAEGTLLFASFSGFKQPLKKWTLVKAFLSYPLMTLKVIGGIHWEALKLWRKGVPLVKRPDPPPHMITVAHS